MNPILVSFVLLLAFTTVFAQKPSPEEMERHRQEFDEKVKTLSPAAQNVAAQVKEVINQGGGPMQARSQVDALLATQPADIQAEIRSIMPKKD